jgi:hypothetical protein
MTQPSITRNFSMNKLALIVARPRDNSGVLSCWWVAFIGGGMPRRTQRRFSWLSSSIERWGYIGYGIEWLWRYWLYGYTGYNGYQWSNITTVAIPEPLFAPRYFRRGFMKPV